MLTLGVAWIFISNAIPFFSQSDPVTVECSSRKARWFCELGAWALTHLPPASQGPLLALGGIAAGALWLYLTWLLLRPLFFPSKN